MTYRRYLALAAVAGLSPRLRPALLEHLAHHAVEQLAARRWRLPAFGPIRLGRCALALAPTADTTDTMGATQ